MTAPNVAWQAGEFIPLPPGYGRQIRRRTISGALLQIFVAIAAAALALWTAQLQRIPGIHEWVDPLWRVNVAVGWVPAVVMIAAAVNAFRVPSAIRGDALRQPDVHRLMRSCRVGWIATLVSGALLAATQFVCCVVVFRRAGSVLGSGDILQFIVPMFTLGFGSVLYLNVRHMMLRWPRQLMRVRSTGPGP
jgi:hypothetical protein